MAPKSVPSMERLLRSGGTHEEDDCRQCEGLIRWCHLGGPEPLAAMAEGVLDAHFFVCLNLCAPVTDHGHCRGLA